MKEYILMFFLIGSASFLKAQPIVHANVKDNPRGNSGLKVGDKMPDLIINQVVNYYTPSFKTTDFKGKILILDFWSTWCTSCLSHFPLADSLQNEFKEDLQIILVNSRVSHDPEAKITKALQKFNIAGKLKFGLPSVINDTLLTRLFPHFYLPHYVWINKEGVVTAVTSVEELTRENVRHLVKENKATLYQKEDYDPTKPLYTADNLPVAKLQQFSILLKGKIDGLGAGGMRNIDGKERGFVSQNNDLLSIYRRIVYGKIPGVSDNRLAIEVKDPSKLSYDGTKQTKQEWERENFYNYELVVPIGQTDRLYDDVIDDLNRYTPYTAKIEKRKMNCWILENTGKADVIYSRGAPYENTLSNSINARLINASLLDLCSYLNEISGNAIIIDKTGYAGNVDLEFKSGTKDIRIMQNYLSHYGLKLYRARQQVDMLVIKDK